MAYTTWRVTKHVIYWKQTNRFNKHWNLTKSSPFPGNYLYNWHVEKGAIAVVYRHRLCPAKHFLTILLQHIMGLFSDYYLSRCYSVPNQVLRYVYWCKIRWGLCECDYCLQGRHCTCQLNSLSCGISSGFPWVNSVLSKIFSVAIEDSISHLIKVNCTPILLYCLEGCDLNKFTQASPDFGVMRFGFRIFRTGSRDVVRDCFEFLPTKWFDRVSVQALHDKIWSCWQHFLASAAMLCYRIIRLS
jgi:hypothetical protein